MNRSGPQTSVRERKGCMPGCGLANPASGAEAPFIFSYIYGTAKSEP
jgi:hypothetical protein